VAFVSEGKIAGLDRPENFKRKYQLDNREEITLQDVFRIINRPD